MATTIQISNDLIEKLRTMKISYKESYENIIWDLIEDSMAISDVTKKNISQSEQEINEGRTISLEQIKSKMKSKNV